MINFAAKVVKNYETRNKKHAKTTETCKNDRKINKNTIFFTKLFDIYKIYCNFAKKFFGNADKKIERLIF